MTYWRQCALCALLVFGSILAATVSVNADGEGAWRDFRQVFPYPHQEIAVYRDDDSLVHIVFSEPPAHLLADANEVAAAAFGEAIQSVNVYKHPIGYDGWAADLVISAIPTSDSQLFDGIVAMTDRAYGTDHKASFLPMERQPWRAELEYLAPAVLPNLKITHQTLHSWLFEEELLFSAEGGTPLPLAELLAAKTTGVLYSNRPGLVLFSLDPELSLNEVGAELRKFTVDSDLVLGAVLAPKLGARPERLVMVGRTRDTAFRDAPPLRLDTILSLAAADVVDLAQSYERNMPFAGRVVNHDIEAVLPPLSPAQQLYQAITGPLGADWAPILLSRELTHTEFGHLLNVTDQILKSWSQSGDVDYGNFIYHEPLIYPFSQGLLAWLRERLGDFDSLTFNWNTSGYGSWMEIDGVEVFAVNRTGALPVSYLPDLGSDEGREDVNITLRAAEDQYWEFFAGLSNPHLVRVAQYTALHQVFLHANIGADRSAPMPPKSVYDERWNALTSAFDVSLTRLLSKNGEPIGEDNGCSYDADSIVAELEDVRSNLRKVVIKDRDDLVTAVVDRSGFVNEKLRTLNRLEQSFNSAVDRLDRDIKLHNRKVNRCQAGRGSGCTDSALAASKQELERREANLTQLERNGQREAKHLGEILEAADTFNVKEARELIKAFGSCDSVIHGIVQGNSSVVGAVYKTPSIVVSRHSRVFFVGGHNIDGRTAQVTTSRSIRRGEFDIDAENGRIRLSPEDASKAPDVARTIERQWRTYQFGTRAERARIERELRDVLDRKVRPPERFSTQALALRNTDNATNQNLPLGARDTRVFVKATEQRIDEVAANALENFASTNQAQIVTQRIGGQYGIFVPGRRPPVMVTTNNTQVFQAHVQRLVNEVANSNNPPKDVVVVSRGGITRTDAENLRITAETRQIIAEAAGGGNDGGLPPNSGVSNGAYFGRGGGGGKGGGGFFGGKRLSIFGDISKGVRQLRRTDLDWRAASVEVRKPGGLIGREGISLAIRIPANHAGGEPVLARLVAAFRGRSATKTDVDLAKATTERAFEDAGQLVIDQSAKDPTLGSVLQRIRSDFERDFGTTPVLFEERADFIIVRAPPENKEARSDG